MSKDIALLERDWDIISQRWTYNDRGCRKTSPCSKGIETVIAFYGSDIPFMSKDIALLERDWDFPFQFWMNLQDQSKDIALLERDWDTDTNRFIRIDTMSRKTSPCSKGIETVLFECNLSSILLSKDIALLERDWDKQSAYYKLSFKSKDIALLERDWDNVLPCGARTAICRKTSPCLKGILKYLFCER